MAQQGIYNYLYTTYTWKMFNSLKISGQFWLSRYLIIVSFFTFSLKLNLFNTLFILQKKHEIPKKYRFWLKHRFTHNNEVGLNRKQKHKVIRKSRIKWKQNIQVLQQQKNQQLAMLAAEALRHTLIVENRTFIFAYNF